MGIFYDAEGHRLVRVDGCSPEPGWTLVTHRLDVSAYHCRRIMREWLAEEDLFGIDWSALRVDPRSA